MKKFKVIVTNDEGPDTSIEERIIRDKLKGLGDFMLEIIYIPPSDLDRLSMELLDCDAVISVYTDFNQEIIKRMKNCKIIALQTIGFNTVDLNAATESGILVTNTPDYCIEDVAVHTFSMALASNRKLKTYDKIARKGIWNIDDIYSHGRLHRLSSPKYGIVSFGNIGRRVAEIAKSFGMEVLAYDPFLKDEVFEEYGIEKISSLDELFKNANIVSLHAPLTPETKNMVSMDQLKLMPEDSVLINTSRGGIINEDDLVLALKNNIIKFACLDVIDDEMSFKSELYELDNCIITPHVAYYSEESLLECREKAAQMVGEVLGGNTSVKYLVNKDVLKE